MKFREKCTFSELGEISSVLALHGDTHHRRHRVFHGVEVVRELIGGDGSGLENVGVHTDKTQDVTSGAVLEL